MLLLGLTHLTCIVSLLTFSYFALVVLELTVICVSIATPACDDDDDDDDEIIDTVINHNSAARSG